MGYAAIKQNSLRADESRRSWVAKDIPNQQGRHIVVTGANSGLGFLTSLELARCGAHVLMAVRDMAKGRAAEAEIRALCPQANIELRQLDLADLDQVKTFGERLLAEGGAVDVLVNNAGIMMPPRSLTRQGHELQFGVNYLAHFALTALLLPRIRQSRDGRVVTISSDLHKSGHIHFDDLSGKNGYGRIAFYAQSKFANALFALELDRQLKAAGVPVKSVLAHPGYAATHLQLSGPDGKNEKKGYPTLVQPVDRARDPDLARRLWNESERLTGVHMVVQP